MITSADKDVDRFKPSYIAGGIVKWCSLFGKPLAIPQKVKPWITICSSNSTPKYIYRRNENMCSHKNLHSNVHYSLFLIAKK